MTKHGNFFWNELNTWDLGKAKTFYAETLGWTYDEMPMEDGTSYCVCKMDEEMVAGIFQLSKPDFDGIPDHWFSYIAVDDVDDRVQKVLNAGGIVKREPWDIPGVGRMAVIVDSNGAAVAYMTPSEEE